VTDEAGVPLGKVERVTRAEHELRGAATALALLCEAIRRDPAVRHHGAALEAQLDRLRAGLADLETLRTGERVAPETDAVELASLTRASMEFAWVGGPVAARLDRRRFAQALGNVLANAAEHGAGAVRVVGRAQDGQVTLEISNRVPPGSRAERREIPEQSEASQRGRGLLIASSAAEQLGGRLSFEIVGDSAVATLHLPYR
jgi:signal transduction histidine kinase